MTTMLKEDYTYNQVFNDNKGYTLVNSGVWSPTPPMGIPNIPNDGSYIELKNYINVSPKDFQQGLPSSLTGLEHAGMITSRNDFQPTHEQQAHDQSATLVWIIILRLAAVAFWVFGIVDAARREFASSGAKIVWVLVVVLLGCFGTLIYLIFGRSQGKILTQTER